MKEPAKVSGNRSYFSFDDGDFYIFGIFERGYAAGSMAEVVNWNGDFFFYVGFMGKDC